MRIENFQVFRDLVDTQSFSQAALRNHISQSAVSQQLKVLEAYFGVQVIDRLQKQFRLTLAGERIYDLGVKLCSACERLKIQLSESAEFVPSGEYCVGVSQGVGAQWVARLMDALMDGFPKLAFTLKIEHPEVIFQALDAGSMQLGIAEKRASLSGLREWAQAQQSYVWLGVPSSMAGGVESIEERISTGMLTAGYRAGDVDAQRYLLSLLKEGPCVDASSWVQLRYTVLRGLKVALLPESLALEAISQWGGQLECQALADSVLSQQIHLLGTDGVDPVRVFATEMLDKGSTVLAEA